MLHWLHGDSRIFKIKVRTMTIEGIQELLVEVRVLKISTRALLQHPKFFKKW
jgi:hypothetical protein